MSKQHVLVHTPNLPASELQNYKLLAEMNYPDGSWWHGHVRRLSTEYKHPKDFADRNRQQNPSNPVAHNDDTFVWATNMGTKIEIGSVTTNRTYPSRNFCFTL